MKVAAAITTMNEADIIGATLSHLYGEGVANIYVADKSTDGTRDILAGFPCKVFDDTEPYHRQPYWMERLIGEAYDDGCQWVLCCDADEFWYATSGQTIVEAIADVPDIVSKLYAKMWQHLDYEMREPNPKSLQKVAVRAGRGNVHIENGNHQAVIEGGSLEGVLSIREIQFRGFEHFCRKIRERCETLDPALPPGEGAHITQFKGWTEEQLRPIWQSFVDRATVEDPIPLRSALCIPR